MFGLMELLGDKLLASSGEVSTTDALAGKTAVAVYFSAHWCPPCRGFTPQLAGWYNTALSAKGLKVVFVSSDKSEAEFTSYFGEQPWAALRSGEGQGGARRAVPRPRGEGRRQAHRPLLLGALVPAVPWFHPEIGGMVHRRSPR